MDDRSLMSTRPPSIQEQQTYYDDRWRSFVFADGMNLERCTAILNALHETGFPEPRIIELGCGPGWLTAILGHFGPAEGVDLSAGAIENASRRYSHVRFKQADLNNWDVPSRTFDVVISHEVIEHLEDQEHHLRTAYDLLDDGGYLILTTPNARTLNATSEAARDRMGKWQPIENWLSARTLRQMLKQRGFQVKTLTSLSLGTGDQGIHRLVNSVKVGMVFARLGLKDVFDRASRRMGFGLHLLAVAQKPSRAACR